jgi:twitching motility protein PilT
MAALDRFLQQLVADGGSDLHLSSTRPPYRRINGVLSPIADIPPLSSQQVLGLVREIMPEANVRQLETEWDTDCAYEIPGVARFRVNGFHDMCGYGAVLRVIPEDIPTFEELNLPEICHDFCRLSKGLVVVTGPTGSGKSTTLSAMIDYINKTRSDHIITIEDPIEFVHKPVRCVINQREIHRDTTTFARALRAALREDPDVVLIGEMRDLETMETAIETAETGHLVFATLHTNTAATTVERMIDKFPGDRQNQIRSMLSDTLRGIIAQTLCKKVSGGRIAAFEVLNITTAAAALIREAKTHMLPSLMQTGKANGMQTFSDELSRLASKGIITPEEAYTKAVDKQDIESKFSILGISMSFREQERQAALAQKMQQPRQTLQSALATIGANKNDIQALCTAAWILATSPFDQLRNGKDAVKYAERACDLLKDKNPAALEILGVAQAEYGSFRRAIDATQRAAKLYLASGDTVKADALNSRVSLFQQSKPYRDE